MFSCSLFDGEQEIEFPGGSGKSGLEMCESLKMSLNLFIAA